MTDSDMRQKLAAMKLGGDDLWNVGFDAAIDRVKDRIGESAAVLYLPHPLITLPIVTSNE